MSASITTQKAKEVQKTIGPIESILNTINNIIQEIPQIISTFSGQ